MGRGIRSGCRQVAGRRGTLEPLGATWGSRCGVAGSSASDVGVGSGADAWGVRNRGWRGICQWWCCKAGGSRRLSRRCSSTPGTTGPTDARPPSCWGGGASRAGSTGASEWWRLATTVGRSWRGGSTAPCCLPPEVRRQPGCRTPYHCSAPNSSKRASSVKPSRAASARERVLAAWVHTTTGSSKRSPAQARTARPASVA